MGRPKLRFMEVIVISLGTPHMGNLKGGCSEKPGGYAGFFRLPRMFCS